LIVGTHDLAPSTERAIYRIVQEALTNATRHTNSGPISVSINETNDAIVTSISNPLPQPISPIPGRGLVNMSERAAIEGGRLDYSGTTGVFEVKATFPRRDRPSP
jgi:signal transduction histidine kinase